MRFTIHNSQLHNPTLLKVLVVENEYSTREYYGHLLTDNGYEVASMADTADDAIRLFEETKPDIVLIDIELDNGSSGIDVGRYIARNNPVPMIFISSFAEKPEYYDAMIKLGMADIILKGTNTDKGLLLKIRQMLHRLSGIQFEEPFSDDANIGIQQPVAHQQAMVRLLLLNDHFFGLANGVYQRVELADVVYAVVEGEISKLHFIHPAINQPLELKIALSKLEEKLPKAHFMRISRDKIINLNYLQSMNPADDTVTLSDDTHKPIIADIGSVYRKELMDWIKTKKI